MANDPSADDQDQAEVLDETHLNRDGEDIANFDDIPDVLDVTQADGDADEEEPEVDDGSEAALADDDIEEDPDGALSPRTRLEDRADDEAAVEPAFDRGSREDRIVDADINRASGFEHDSD